MGYRMSTGKSATTEDSSMCYGLPASECGLGRPVVLIHGFPMDHSIWDDQVQCLASRYRVIAPDLCSIGRGSAPPQKSHHRTMGRQLGRHARLPEDRRADRLGRAVDGRLHRLPVFSSSTAAAGGADSLRHAGCGRHAAGRRGPVGDGRAAGTRRDLVSTGRHAAAIACTGHLGGKNRHRRAAAADDPRRRRGQLRGHPPRPGRAARFHAVVAQDRLSHAFDRGAAGRDFPAGRDGGHGRIPGARLAEINGAGHVTPLEVPEAVSRAIEEFLDFTAARSSTGS